MSKLFEIPIYAFTPDILRKRVNEHKESLEKEYKQSHQNDDQSHMRNWIFLCCHPFQLWDYNHIVGFIVISFDKCDVFFDLFLQAQGIYNKTRYYWNSKQKWLLDNQHLGGWHFRLDDTYSSEDVRIRIHSLLDGLIRDRIPKSFYVDREAFDAVDKMIDYTRLLKGE